MKNKFLKVVKTIAIITLAVSLVVIGSVSMPSKVQATESSIDGPTENGVQYVKYTNLDYDAYFGTRAPEYNAVDDDGVGYVFGGWYEKNENKYTPIQTKEKLDSAKEKQAVVAKFVPAQVLSVKCQNWAGTDENSENTIVRIISAVDSQNYSSYGFELSRKSDDDWVELGTYDSNQNDNKYYSKFNYYENSSDVKPVATYEPDDLFGESASYFTTCTLGRVPAAAYGTIICVKPFWKTLDGTTVYGLSKYAHVEDGYLNYINVPVNVNILNENNNAVAGMLNVISENGLELVDVEFGKLFDEMDTNTVLSDGKVIVRCVGNMIDISKEINEMDIYVNLRFQGEKVADVQTLPHYTFTVTDEEFCDNEKNILQNDDVWNVKY